MKRFLKAGLVLALAGAGLAHAATELVIATVNNGHMIEMQKLTQVLREGQSRTSSSSGSRSKKARCASA